MNFLVALAALLSLDVRRLSRLQRHPVRADRRAARRVLLTDPSAVRPVFTGLFMEKMVVFVKLYFPVFLLGAVFGKVIELSGFSQVDRRRGDRLGRPAARDPVDRARLRDR